MKRLTLLALTVVACSAPADFDWFGQMFPDLVAEAHEASPSTLVFLGFQPEWLSGLKGGPVGGITWQDLFG